MTKVRCEGCGRTGNEETWEQDIRATHPSALTCCPDRNLKPVPLTVWVVSYVGFDEEWISRVFQSKEKAEEFVASKDDSNFWKVQGWEVE